MCSYLLKCGANPLHLGYKGMTAFELAQQEGRKSVVALLSTLDSSADTSGLAERYNLDKEILYLLNVAIPQQRAQEKA